MGRTRKNPIMVVSAVPNDSRSRNDDVFPGNRMCASVEKKNPERPTPETTIPVVVAS